MTETKYQKRVNSLTGAMGPTQSAFWKDTGSTTGNPWSLGAQPLFYQTAGKNAGRYVTSYEANAGPSVGKMIPASRGWGVLGSWSPSSFKKSFGKRKFGKYRKFGRRRFGSCGKCGMTMMKFGRKRFGGCGCNDKKKRYFGKKHKKSKSKRKRSRRKSRGRKRSKKSKRRSRKKSRKGRKKSKKSKKRSKRRRRKRSKKRRKFGSFGSGRANSLLQM